MPFKPSDYDVDSGDTTTTTNSIFKPEEQELEPRDNSYTPQALTTQDLPVNQGKPFDLSVLADKTPPATSPAGPSIVPQGTSPKLPGMPADVDPEEIARYIQGQKAQINRFGPDQQMELQKKLTDQRKSPLFNLGMASETMGDALMQGVARAGSSNGAEQYLNQANQLANEQTGTMARAGQQNLQQVEAGQKMDMQDPKSPISKSYQDAFGPVFQKMGLRGWKNMPASQISTVAELNIKYADVQTQAELKRAMLAVEQSNKQVEQQLRGQQIQATTANNQAERAFNEQKLKTEHPILNAVGALPQMASGMASGAAGQLTPDVISYAKAHNITPEQAQQVKMKRMGGQ